MLSFWYIWDNESGRGVRSLGDLFTFLGVYPVGGFENADNWVYWVGTTAVVDDRLVTEDTWRNKSEEMVAVRLVDRLALAKCNSVGIGSRGGNNMHIFLICQFSC